MNLAFVWFIEVMLILVINNIEGQWISLYHVMDGNWISKMTIYQYMCRPADECYEIDGISGYGSRSKRITRWAGTSYNQFYK